MTTDPAAAIRIGENVAHAARVIELENPVCRVKAARLRHFHGTQGAMDSQGIKSRLE